MILKKGIFASLVLTLALAGTTLAQSFEGVIEFRKITPRDTSYYKYHVKGNNVRIEDIGSKGNISGVMLVDLNAKKVTALNSERKLYMEVENKPATPVGKPEINKNSGSKKVAGQDCKIWKVNNKEESTEVTYAVSNGKYDFFVPLLKTLNRKDKSAVYFLMIPDNAGVFPLEATEVAAGHEKNRLVTTKIEKKTVDAKMFEIPKDYQKYQK